MTRGLSYLIAIACVAVPCAALAQPSHHASRIRAENACAAMGLEPSEAPFTSCVLSLENSVGAPAEQPLGYVAQQDQYQRGDQMTSIRRACAEMGLAPGSQQYQSCFGNLNMTIDDANRSGTD